MSEYYGDGGPLLVEQSRSWSREAGQWTITYKYYGDKDSATTLIADLKKNASTILVRGEPGAPNREIQATIIGEVEGEDGPGDKEAEELAVATLDFEEDVQSLENTSYFSLGATYSEQVIYEYIRKRYAEIGESLWLETYGGENILFIEGEPYEWTPRCEYFKMLILKGVQGRKLFRPVITVRSTVSATGIKDKDLSFTGTVLKKAEMPKEAIFHMNLTGYEWLPTPPTVEWDGQKFYVTKKYLGSPRSMEEGWDKHLYTGGTGEAVKGTG